MKRPFEIGITGGIGSGKSLVCRIFHCLGVPVYDADSQAKELMYTDKVLASQIQNAFGPLAFSPDGQLNRPYLAKEVFGNPERLEMLNRLVHPRVQEHYTHWVSRQDYHYTIKEAALIFEAGSYKSLHAVVVVSAPEEIRLKRVMLRDSQRTEDEVRKIVRNQMPEDEKLKRASFVIINDESTLVIPQVLRLHERFSTMT